MGDNPGGLTNKQIVFVEAYLETWSATEAARRAGYAQPHSQGPRLLENVGVRAVIKHRLAEKAMEADEVIARLADQARANAGDFFVFEDDPETGRLKATGINWEEVRNRGHLIKKISWNNHGPVLELYDAQAALVNIGRHLVLFTDKMAPTDPTGTKEYGGYRDALISKLSQILAGGGEMEIPKQPE